MYQRDKLLSRETRGVLGKEVEGGSKEDAENSDTGSVLVERVGGKAWGENSYEDTSEGME